MIRRWQRHQTASAHMIASVLATSVSELIRPVANGGVSA